MLFMITMTISIFNSFTSSLIFISAFTISIFILKFKQSEISSPVKFFHNIRGFLIFLIVIIITRGLTVEGKPITGLPFFSIGGIYTGLHYSWKLFLLILWGQLFTSTTAPSHIYGTVYTLFSKIPFLNAGTIATMISLTLTFIPLLFDQYIEIKNALDSRLGSFTRNPLKKISSLSLPLLQSSIGRADEIAMAMESRCYSENPTLPEMKMKRSDRLSLIILVLFIICVILLNKYNRF